jgi:hypothetical protein
MRGAEKISWKRKVVSQTSSRRRCGYARESERLMLHDSDRRAFVCLRPVEAVTKLHASRSRKNLTPLQHEQWNTGE